MKIYWKFGVMFENLSLAQGAPLKKSADWKSDGKGKHVKRVLMTLVGSWDLAPKWTSSKVSIAELLRLKSDHSLFSSEGPPSSLPAMLCFETRLSRPGSR